MAESSPLATAARNAFEREAVRVIVGVAVMITLASVAQASRVDATTRRQIEQPAVREISSNVPDPQALRWVSLGHHEALADLVWLNALSFFGEHFARRHDPRWLFPHFEAITTLDPHFMLVYEWAGTAIMYGGEITNTTVMASNEVLEQGIEQFPLAWNLHFMLGVNYAVELRPSSPEQRAQWRSTGGAYIARAATLPNAPAYLTVVAQTYLRDSSDWAVRYDSLASSMLWLQNRLDVNSARAQLRIVAPPDLSEPLVARLELLRYVTQQPDWVASPPGVTLVAHPDPDYVAPVEDIFSP